MKKRLEIFNFFVCNVDLDDDIYFMITDRYNRFKVDINNNICIVNRKGIRVPIWRIVRKCFNKGLTCKYKDGDNTNLKRNNLELIRKT